MFVAATFLTACQSESPTASSQSATSKSSTTSQSATAEGKPNTANNPNSKPSLTVEVTAVVTQTIPQEITAYGSIAPWQEATISAEVSGVPVIRLVVQDGDRVKAGQVLAEFKNDMIAADVELAQASLMDANARLQEAQAQWLRITNMKEPGVISAQEKLSNEIAVQTAKARVQQATATLKQQRIRFNNTRVKAPVAGTISARMVQLGSVPNVGEPLFKLIANHRLEWRSELTENQLAQIKPGQKVKITTSHGVFTGTVRAVSASLNAQTRMGLAYVDIPNALDEGLQSGMYTQGTLTIGKQQALLVPQSAIAMRDGYNTVFVLNPDAKTVRQAKVSLGNTWAPNSGEDKQEQWVIVQSGLSHGQKIIKSGVAFLADGDTVHIAPSAQPPVTEAVAKANIDLE